MYQQKDPAKQRINGSVIFFLISPFFSQSEGDRPSSVCNVGIEEAKGLLSYLAHQLFILPNNKNHDFSKPIQPCSKGKSKGTVLPKPVSGSGQGTTSSLQSGVPRFAVISLITQIVESLFFSSFEKKQKKASSPDPQMNRKRGEGLSLRGGVRLCSEGAALRSFGKEENCRKSLSPTFSIYLQKQSEIK